LVLLVGIALGWSLRKAIGPGLVSEQLPAPAKPAAATRPAPVGIGDPAARAWLDDAASLRSPRDSLLTLKKQLENGEISDFDRVARSLLSHPLPLFRQEAMAALLPAWGREEPAEALKFYLAYESSVVGTLGEKNRPGLIARDLGRGLALRDPEAALRLLPPESKEQPRTWALGIWQGLGTPGPEGSMSLVDRFKLIESIQGAAAASKLLGQMNMEPWTRAGRWPKPDDWRALAEGTTTLALRTVYQGHAMETWLADGGSTRTAAEARAWLGQSPPAVVEATLALRVERPDPSHVASLLSPDRATDLPNRMKNGLLLRLMQENPAQARAAFSESGAAGWVDAGKLGNALRGQDQGELQAWLRLLPEPEQRQELLRHLILPEAHPKSPEELATLARDALAFGVDGESAAVALLTDRARPLAPHLPDVFASWPPDVQARTRLEMAVGLANRSPDVAAEIWMDATPEELAQPGAGVVAEDIAVRLLQRDPEVGSAWIQQLPPGESRDRAVARMIERTAHEDPATCAEWAATIVDPAARARADTALRKAPPVILTQ
jgi:hypothetical protein